MVAERMSFGRVLKAISIGLFILGFSGSVILGNTFAVIKSHYDFQKSFNWAVFLYAVIPSFIICLLIYALGEIIEQLECISDDIYQLSRKLESEDEEKIEKTYSTPTAPTVIKTADGGWICKKCRAKNESSARFCKDCGAYR